MDAKQERLTSVISDLQVYHEDLLTELDDLVFPPHLMNPNLCVRFMNGPIMHGIGGTSRQKLINNLTTTYPWCYFGDYIEPMNWIRELLISIQTKDQLIQSNAELVILTNKFHKLEIIETSLYYLLPMVIITLILSHVD